MAQNDQKCQFWAKLAKKNNIWPNITIFEPKIHFWGHGEKLLVSSIREPMRKFLKSLMFILEKGTFFFEQLFPVVARTWSELSFFCQESRFLAQKSDFCHTTPILINGPILAWFRRDASFPTLGTIFRLFVPKLWPFS